MDGCKSRFAIELSSGCHRAVASPNQTASMNAVARSVESSSSTLDLGLVAELPDARSVGMAVSVAHELIEWPLWPSRLRTEERERSEVLLSVMTYCYARGWFACAEVERLAGENPSVRWLAGGGAVPAAEVKAFRQRHFSLVASSLAEFVLRSAVLHPGEAIAAEAQRLRRAVAEKHAQERLTMAVLNESATA